MFELIPDPIKFGITIVNFLIFLVILIYLFYKPVLKIISSREEEISNSILQSEENKTIAEKNKLDSETLLKESRKKGKEIVEEYKGRAERLSADIIKDANVEAQTIIDRAQKEIERQKEKVEYELKSTSVDIAVMLASKALQSSINEEEHKRLINDFISKVGI